MNTMHDLLLETARHLLQEPVAILYNMPADARLLAHAQRSIKGIAVINMSPLIAGDDLATYIFLHECAHLKLQRFKHLPVKERPTMPDKGTGYKREIYQKHENEADTLARHWLSWGRLHNKDGSLSQMEAVCTALLEYPIDDTKGMK